MHKGRNLVAVIWHSLWLMFAAQRRVVAMCEVRMRITIGSDQHRSSGAAVMAAALIVCVGSSVAADDIKPTKPWISEADLRGLMLQRPMAGVYPGGTPWRETIYPDGTSDYVENGERKPGKWWFDKEGYLCFNYPSTGTGGCFKYVKLTANCYEHFSKPRQDEPADQGSGGTFHGLATNGRLWSDDKPSTCEAEPTV